MAKRTFKSAGLLPGTLVPPPGAHVPKTIHVIRYTADDFEEVDVSDSKEVARYKDMPGVKWLNVDGLGNVEMMEELGQLFGLHRLALEDAMDLSQRPKVDDYQDHLFVVTRMVRYDGGVDIEQVSLFLCRNVVVTFQEKPGDCLESIRDRLRKSAGQIRKHGADYLMYAILDTIIDNYFPLLEKVGEVVEVLENTVVENPERRTVERIHNVKRDLLDIRRSIWPLREAVNGLVRDESPLVGKTTRVYLRDCYDHAVHVLEVVETYRELAGGLMEVYLSSLSNKMNEVMKVLTIIATVFIPLTFIAGIYGMNFVHMPELASSWGYPAVWCVMFVVTVAMLVFFRRRGWLGGGKGGSGKGF